MDTFELFNNGKLVLPEKETGVLVSGRYGHGKPRKPVNTALSALHRV